MKSNNMKSKLLFSFLFIGQFVAAQTFTEVLNIPFVGVSESSIAFADIDGDNDQDVFITGQLNSGEGISKLYRNDGAGNFIELPNLPFEGIRSGSIAFADVDGDNDQDLLITGRLDSLRERISKLYINDGVGNFTEKQGTPFIGVSSGSVAFADIDNDNDQDVIIMGVNPDFRQIPKLFKNDGFGNFTEIQNTPFINVEGGTIVFSDVDMDNDQDVFITGYVSLGIDGFSISKLYLNDGLGNFTEKPNTPFFSTFYGSMAFSDVDGDNDQDLFITGGDIATDLKAKLYLNDGMGTFVEVPNTPFLPIWNSSIAFSDIDRDNDQDLLITGLDDWNSSDTIISKLYLNDGFGNFTELLDTPFEGVKYSSIAFADVDGDNYQDVLITGNNGFTGISKLYLNDGNISTSNFLTNPLDFEFIVHPNPTKATKINVNYQSKEKGLANVSIFDSQGKLLKQHQEQIKVENQNFSINISSLKKGVYFIQLQSGVRKGVKKFVVE